jgi:prevent-host-death family protein
MEDFQKILPVSKAKRDFLDLLKQMEQEGSTIALTRDGEAVGVMMPLARYEEQEGKPTPREKAIREWPAG